MRTWSIAGAVGWALTPVAVVADGVIRTLWPPRYVPVEVPDTWLDTVEEEQEVHEPKDEVWQRNNELINSLVDWSSETLDDLRHAFYCNVHRKTTRDCPQDCETRIRYEREYPLASWESDVDAGAIGDSGE